MIIGFPQEAPSKGGPGSFQIRFERILKDKGWEICYANENKIPDVAFILGGTRNIKWLLKLKLKKVPVVYRLGGIDWLNDIKEKNIFKKAIKHIKLKLLVKLQAIFASGIVFQSNFAKKWLKYFKQSANASTDVIIYNGVNTSTFRPKIEDSKYDKSLLCVEGNIDYSPYAITLLNELQRKLIGNSEYKSIIVYGGFENEENRKKLHPEIQYKGSISREEIPSIYRNATFLSLDVNATCPNTVLEAMASGIPVIGFDTGALPELVIDNSGILTSYGSDPWKMNYPDVDGLIDDAKEVLKNWKFYSHNARINAEKNFNLTKTSEKYISFIEEIISANKNL